MHTTVLFFQLFMVFPIEKLVELPPFMHLWILNLFAVNTRQDRGQDSVPEIIRN